MAVLWQLGFAGAAYKVEQLAPTLRTVRPKRAAALAWAFDRPSQAVRSGRFGRTIKVHCANTDSPSPSISKLDLPYPNSPPFLLF